MIKAALFGGAFDPLTLDHIKIANRLAEEGYYTLVMPCFHHRFGKAPTPAEIRFDAIRDVSIVSAKKEAAWLPCSWEVNHRHSGSMYEALKEIKAEYNDCKEKNLHFLFHIVIGMDNANSIFQWDRGELLIEENPFIVVKRKGVEPTTDWFTKPPHRVLEVEGAEISSTQVREAVARGDYDLAKSLVHPIIWNYISAFELYGYKNA